MPKKKKEDIKRPKKDVKIDDEKPKFKEVLTHFIKDKNNITKK